MRTKTSRAQTIVFLNSANLRMSEMSPRQAQHHKSANLQEKHKFKILNRMEKVHKNPFISVSTRAHYWVQMNISWKAFLWTHRMPCCDGVSQTCQRAPMWFWWDFVLYQKLSRLGSEKDPWFLNNYWELDNVMLQSGAEELKVECLPCLFCSRRNECRLIEFLFNRLRISWLRYSQQYMRWSVLCLSMYCLRMNWTSLMQQAKFTCRISSIHDDYWIVVLNRRKPL